MNPQWERQVVVQPCGTACVDRTGANARMAPGAPKAGDNLFFGVWTRCKRATSLVRAKKGAKGLSTQMQTDGSPAQSSESSETTRWLALTVY